MENLKNPFKIKISKTAAKFVYKLHYERVCIEKSYKLCRTSTTRSMKKLCRQICSHARTILPLRPQHAVGSTISSARKLNTAKGSAASVRWPTFSTIRELTEQPHVRVCPMWAQVRLIV